MLDGQVEREPGERGQMQIEEDGGRAFDAQRLFEWRNWNDYGTGVAGDLFVHLFTGIHFVLDSQGPTRVFAGGGLRTYTCTLRSGVRIAARPGAGSQESEVAV